MDKVYYQKRLELFQEETLEFKDPLYYKFEKTPFGRLTKLALKEGVWSFAATHQKGKQFNVTHITGLSFLAELSNSCEGNKLYKIKSSLKNNSKDIESCHDNVKINGVGPSGESLRTAQLGATYSLLSHWSLSREVATIVMPTGTGKTETMLISTLADRAKRTLVIVPTIDLKNQIADKFATWGILRELGVIPIDSPNPTVLVLTKTLSNESCIKFLEKADIIVSTPALIARADEKIKSSLKRIFSHVFFDEAHHVKAKEWESLKNLFFESKIVQFTATPYRADRKPIEGKVVYNYPLSQALKDNCFSKISLISVDERHPKRKDKAIAEAAMNRLYKDRENGYSRHRMMVRAMTQNHAQDLFSKYQAWFPNEKIVLVHAGIKEKSNIVKEIKEGKFDIIICVEMLKEGFDYPDLKIAAVHGIHKSLAVLLQFIGRFTRVQKGLGDASFVVNYAEESISLELENLLQEGSGWEEIISEIADAKKAEAESLLHFLQGCKPYLGFDSPNIELNPKLVYPALSCVCFHSTKVDWSKFKSAFNLKKYALSRPFINNEENVFYFTTQKREKVKWARTENMRDQKWDLIVMHHDHSSGILYIGYSEKSLDVEKIVEFITGSKPLSINGDAVFRAFDSIKRLCIVHAGIFKPANHLHRYSRLSGADVTTELTKWKNGNRCKKSDFVGFGFRNGFPVSVGASVKGKIWSPARIGDLKEWKKWCLEIGSLITDENIDPNHLLEDSAAKTQLEKYPADMVVLATDWSGELYDRIHKLTLEKPNGQSIMLSECVMKFNSFKDNCAEFSLFTFEDKKEFSVVLGSENGHSIKGLDDCDLYVDGLKSNPIPLKKFFEENPPNLFLLNSSTISGSIYTDYGETVLKDIPSDRIKELDWIGVDYTKESLYKSDKKRKNSIQEYMMKHFINQGAKIVFNDDNSGESADIIAVFWEEDLIRFELTHCKYSKEKSGTRLSDLFEVCGQAIVSLRYKWRPEELLKHMVRRNGIGVLAGKRFYFGTESALDEVRRALKYTNVQFEFAIAQPGVESSKLTSDMKNFLGSVYSTVIEMTETKLKCFFNK